MKIEPVAWALCSSTGDIRDTSLKPRLGLQVEYDRGWFDRPLYAIPDDMVLMPKKLTNAMIDAAIEGDDWYEAYQLMIDAAQGER